MDNTKTPNGVRSHCNMIAHNIIFAYSKAWRHISAIFILEFIVFSRVYHQSDRQLILFNQFFLFLEI